MSAFDHGVERTGLQLSAPCKFEKYSKSFLNGHESLSDLIGSVEPTTPNPSSRKSQDVPGCQHCWSPYDTCKYRDAQKSNTSQAMCVSPPLTFLPSSIAVHHERKSRVQIELHDQNGRKIARKWPQSGYLGFALLRSRGVRIWSSRSRKGLTLPNE